MKRSKTVQKIFSILLCVALLVTVIPLGTITAFAAEKEIAETSYIFSYYTYEVSDSEVTITDCDTAISGEIIIPSELGGYPVTAIGMSAFYFCRNITKLTIPDGVREISDSAFYDCYKLQSITIPDSVTEIGSSAFAGCESLTEITIPDGVTEISYSAFYDCSSLTEITIPDGVTEISASAFYGCKKLKSITIPDSVTEIGSRAFYNCYELQSITIPDSVTEIGISAFYNCDSLKDITIPAGVTVINTYTFYSCDDLKSVTIPESVTDINNYAFENCFKLKTVSYGGSRTDKGLLYVSSGNSYLTNATWYCDKCATGASHTYTNNCDSDCDVCFATRLVIPHSYVNDCDTVCDSCLLERDTSHTYTSDCDTTCNVCSEKREITHTYDNGCDDQCNVCYASRPKPKHVKNIYTVSEKTMVDTADGGYVQDQNLSSSKIVVKALYDFTFNMEYSTEFEDDDKFVIKLNAIDQFVVTETSSLTTYSIDLCEGDKLEIIYKNVYYDYPDENEVSVKILTSPQIFAEDYNTYCDLAVMCDECGATAIEPKDHVYSSEYDTKCNECERTRKVEPKTFDVENFTYQIVPDENGGSISLIAVSNLTDGAVVIPAEVEGISVTAIGERAFDGCAGITEITIPDSVIKIGKYAFYNCSKIKSITIPESVTKISDCMFSGCTGLLELQIPFLDRKFAYLFGERQYEISSDIVPHSLKHITINGGVIPEHAFEGCDSISDVILGDGVTSIERGAFYDCNSVTRVTIGNGTETIGVSAFQNCVSLTHATIGSSVITIENSAFEDCVSLIKIVIPDSVTKIKDNAFENCYSLGTVSFGKSVEHIGNYTFANCISLAEAIIPNSTTLIGSHAFENCTALAKATFGNSLTTIFDYAFANCTSLGNIVLPSSTTSVGEYTFTNCTSLKQATLKGRMDHINNGTFESCTNLQIVAFPTNITTIAYNAFNACSNLNEVWYTGTKDERDLLSIAYGNDPIKNAAWTYGWVDTENHEYDNDCDTVCNLCGAIREISHTYVWVVDKEPYCGNDGLKHEECTVCHAKRNENTAIDTSQKHVYDNDNDDTCNVCGQLRTESNALLGDANGDGKINIKDATHIQKAIASLVTLDATAEESADVNGDGKVNIKDATAIQKHIAGIDTGYFA